MKRVVGVILGTILILTSCDLVHEEVVMPISDKLMEIPKGFPAMEHPEDNSFTQARWELGKKLFYDPILSVDQSVSCSSCHQASIAFSDQETFSIGAMNRPGTRNAPTLANIGYHPYFTREGGVPTLEMQILVPIQEHNEFDFNILLIADRLNQDSTYIRMALEAYDREPDPFVITRAIACFERSLISGLSPYDLFRNYDKKDALSESAKRGKDLFFSERTNCSSCHSGFNFTNYSFANNGLYESYQDEGRYRLTGDPADLALFKVPTLRNIELTGPYMHDGSITSLSAVIDHYQTGGKNHTNKSQELASFQLNAQEKEDLITFLLSLTDDYFVTNALYR